VTDSNGSYRFSSAAGTSSPSFVYGLTSLTPNSDFSVRIDMSQAPLVGLTASPLNYNGVAGDHHDSDGDTSINAGFATALLSTEEAGHNNHTYDFGFFRPFSLGNRVWLDADNNGLLETGELGIDGVSVSLFLDADANGVPDDLGSPVLSTTTANGGYYRFDDLPADSYVVRINPSNFTGAGILVGYSSSTPASAAPNGNADNDDNGINNAAPATNGILSGVITLGPNADEPLNETDVLGADQGAPDAQANLTVDFGFFALYSLGNQVWDDRNNDGLLNNGETGVDGVAVRLYRDTNNDNTPDGAAIATTTTANGGYYLFTELVAGNYLVEIVAPAGYKSSTGYLDATISDYEPAPDPDNDINNDDNGTTLSGQTIRSNTVTLSWGAEPSNDGAMPSGYTDAALNNNANYTVDFGIYRPMSLGNLVWRDDNNNGLVDGSEPGIAGVTVRLYIDNNNDGIPDDVTGNGLPSTVDDAIRVTSTNSTGHYLFTDLGEGQYIVEVVTPSGMTSSTGLTLVPQTPPINPRPPYEGAPDPDDNIDNDDNGTNVGTNNAVVRTATVELRLGTEPLGEPATPGLSDTNADNNANYTVDFGFYPYLSLGNRVWFDSNNNGVIDAGETGVSGVTVRLYRDGNNDGVPDDLTGNGVVDSNDSIAHIHTAQTSPHTIDTNASGHYLFSNLSAGNYIIELDNIPVGYRTSTGAMALTGPYEPAPDPDTLPEPDNDDNGSLVGTGIRSGTVSLTIDGEPTGETATTGITNAANDNRSNLTVDFGLFLPVNVGDLIFVDVDANGFYDPAIDRPLAGAVVSLLASDGISTVTNIDGQPVTSQTTGADGLYNFSNLWPGDYVVTVSAPTGFISTTDTTDTNDPNSNTNNDDNGPGSGNSVTSGIITLTGGQEPAAAVDGDGTNGNLTVDFGFFELASLGNLVWYDTDVDGVQDGGETGVPNVTVTLYNAADNSVVSTMSTDANGEYLFEQLLPGSYYVIFSDLPAGYGFVPPDQGGNDALDSDANQITGRTGTYTLVAGQHEPTVDAGIAPSTHLRLGNLVWADYNDNGLVDSGEPGIAGVTVELLDGTGATVLATTTSDANGNYLFSNLNPGEYIVRIPASQFATGAVLESWSSSVGGGSYEPAPDPDSNTSDNRDNGSTQGTGDVQSLPITLTLGNEPDTAVDGDDRDGNLTVDFGFVPQLASLGDTVWYDSTRNNIQDSGEAGVPNVTVRLLDSTNTVIATTTTLANGTYLFDNLVPGVYSVEFDISTLPTNYRFVAQDVGGDDMRDSDANPSTGRTIQTTLTAGENDLSWDAGIYQLASIGDRVWYDANRDGVQDPMENGVPNVTVNLLDGSGTLIASTITDANGNYQFIDLEPGNYAIEVVPPAGYAFTLQDSASGTDSSDSDVDPTTGRTIVTTLDPGEDDRDWDAGLIDIMSLGNLVWLDSNNNGTVDLSENGMSGITVNLYRDSNNDGTPDGAAIATTTTNVTGHYLFTALISDTYIVEIVPPVGYLSSTGRNASASGSYEPAPNPNSVATDNDDNGTTIGVVIRSAPISLSPGDEPTGEGTTSGISDPTPDANSNLTVDFGLYQPASLGNYVWHDENQNGLQDTGESGVADVTVTLYDGSGSVITTTTTDSTGAYRFDNLAPGSYSVGFSNLPVELDRFTSPNQGSDDALDSDADTVTGRTQPITLAAGEHNPTIDAGIHGTTPTAIRLSSFEAKWQVGKLVVTWSTSSERETWGFYLLRSPDGSRAKAEQVNATIVLGKGRSGQTASYQLVDEGAQAGVVYHYWLKEVELDGSEHFYGPFLLQSEQPAAHYSVLLPLVRR
jgi:protocatechuate 3,4-dioxygenase beta subunit